MMSSNESTRRARWFAWSIVVPGLFALAAVTEGCSSDSTPATDPGSVTAPPHGQGFQFKTDEVLVPAGTEEQDCYFFRVRDLAAAGGLPADQPIEVHRIEASQRPGSHHMNIFRVRTIAGLDPASGPVVKGTNGAGECFKSSNWADWPLVANTQKEGNLDFAYPDGVVNEMQPDEWLMLQTHYVNASSQKTPANAGLVTVNFWTIPKSEVKAQLGTVFATKQSIRICPNNPTPSFSGSCQIHSSAPVTIVGANAHFHSRGTKFDMYTWDGTSITTPPDANRFYESKSWDEPPMTHWPDLAVTVPANGGVFYTCDYQWVQPPNGCTALNDFDKKKYGTPDADLNCCYTFGPIVETNEHCNAFIYYYPKQDDVTCF